MRVGCWFTITTSSCRVTIWATAWWNWINSSIPFDNSCISCTETETPSLFDLSVNCAMSLSSYSTQLFYRCNAYLVRKISMSNPIASTSAASISLILTKQIVRNPTRSLKCPHSVRMINVSCARRKLRMRKKNLEIGKERCGNLS